MAATISVLRWDKEPLELHEGDVFELEAASRVDLEVLPMTESFLRSVRLQKL